MAFGRVGALGGGFGRLGTGTGGGVEALSGGALMLVGETNGLAIDYTEANDSKRVAVKTTNVVVNSTLDAFHTNAATASPKYVFNSAGSLIWSPHNLFLNSEAPVTQSVTLIIGYQYTVTVTGSGSLAATLGASGTATEAVPLVFTATTTAGTFTKTGTLTRMQMNRGAVATDYLATTGGLRTGLAVDYHPSTHVAHGLLVEPAATNILLNSATLSTQSVTVTAVAHTLSFMGTGTITLSGVSTAGPLVGTGASNRVSLLFTPTAGSLTCTVSGTVSNAQLEIGSVPTSIIPTFGVAVTRAADNFTFLLSTIPALGAEWSLYCRYATPSVSSGRHVVVVTDGTTNEYVGLRTNVFPNLNVVDGGASQVNQNNGTLVADTFISTAFRVKLNDFSMSSNGTAVTGDVGATLPTVTEVRFGGSGNNGPSLAVYRVQKLMLVPRAWSDAELALRSAA